MSENKERTVKVVRKKRKLKKISWDTLFKEKRNLYIFIISIVLVIALIVGLVVALSGEKKQVEPEAEKEVAEENYDATKGVIDTKEFDKTILAETKDAGEEYIDGTLFLGDSNTARFLVYGETTSDTFTTKQNTIGVVGMGIDAISSLKCMEFSGTGLVTMPKAVSILQPERIIITFGTNNLSGTSTDATDFIARYKKQLKAIVDAYPTVDLIVNAIPPIGEKRDYPNLSMTQIDAYNKAIVKMCDEEGYKFLNSSEALKDEKTGYAKEGYTVFDGLHLSQKGLEALFTYIRTHSYITDDDRPKPLAAIPSVVGVPSGLIQTNPIEAAGSQGNVPVEFTATAGGSLSGATSQSVGKGGTTGAVTAIASEGYTFAYWGSNYGETFSSATISYTVPANADANGIVLVAYFNSNGTPTPTIEATATATPTPTPVQSVVPTQDTTCSEYNLGYCVSPEACSAIKKYWYNGVCNATDQVVEPVTTTEPETPSSPETPASPETPVSTDTPESPEASIPAEESSGEPEPVQQGEEGIE